MQNMNFDNLTEKQEETIGKQLVECFQLKEAKHGTHPRNLKSYDPPRYFTARGTKSALGLARTVFGIIQDGTK